MKKAHRLVVASGTAILSLAIGQPLFAQNAPSQADFGRALRPIPQVLQGGHSGISTVPPSVRPAPSLNYSTVSVPASAPAPTSNYSRVSAPASTGRAEIPDTAYPRGTSRRSNRIATHASPHTAAALLGCPAVAETSEKPKIGFPVSFEFGSAQLKSESLETLRNLGKALNQDLGDQKLFVIEGHTDAVGTLAYNEELSKLRAEAVKDFLVRETGVSAERLEIVGKAYCDPVDRQNPRGAENRRVVVINQSS